MHEVVLMFQGGFVGRECEVFGIKSDMAGDESGWESIMKFYPDDINSEQISFFPIACPFCFNHI